MNTEREENTALVDDTTTQETNEASAETSVEETKEFDANAFSKMEEVSSNESNASETSIESVENSTDDSDDESYIEWDISDSSGEETQAQETTEETSTNNEEQKQTTSENTNDETVAPQVDYSSVSEKLGIEIKSEEDIISYVDNIKSQAVGNTTNDKIKRLEGYIQLDDRELLKADLKAQGFNDADVTEAMETFEDNGTIKIEAKKIRNALNRNISAERNSIIEKQNADAKQQEQEVKEIRSNIRKVIDESETMFGFKMAKDAETLGKVRDNHYKYTTEQFMKDITKDEKSMVEVAWLWKHKDVILNAAKNKGLQKGKESVLSQITKPDTDSVTRIREESTKEFDPNKFVS